MVVIGVHVGGHDRVVAKVSPGPTSILSFILLSIVKCLTRSVVYLKLRSHFKRIFQSTASPKLNIRLVLLGKETIPVVARPLLNDFEWVLSLDRVVAERALERIVLLRISQLTDFNHHLLSILFHI